MTQRPAARGARVSQLIQAFSHAGAPKKPMSRPQIEATAIREGLYLLNSSPTDTIYTLAVEQDDGVVVVEPGFQDLKSEGRHRLDRAGTAEADHPRHSNPPPCGPRRRHPAPMRRPVPSPWCIRWPKTTTGRCSPEPPSSCRMPWTATPSPSPCRDRCRGRRILAGGPTPFGGGLSPKHPPFNGQRAGADPRRGTKASFTTATSGPSARTWAKPSRISLDMHKAIVARGIKADFMIGSHMRVQDPV